LLDFGCGGGSYLQRMHELGWKVTGLDVSPVAVERIRTRLGLRALTGSLPHRELSPGSFDVVTMWHSLEHVHHPLVVLRAAHRLLMPGGKLLVAAPNIDSLPFRWFGAAWYGLDLPRHLTHFTPATLAAAVQAAGFRVSGAQMLRHSRWLRESAALAIQQRALPAWQRWLRGKIASRLITACCQMVREADCILLAAES
jgi:2-polyprenyl-3-methyl-5-hydroxy-6-metoxy-1,4-benzoquinol methylase